MRNHEFLVRNYVGFCMTTVTSTTGQSCDNYRKFKVDDYITPSVDIVLKSKQSIIVVSISELKQSQTSNFCDNLEANKDRKN